MTPGITFPTFGALCKRARERGLEVGLTVDTDPLDKRLHRELASILIRLADKPKGVPLSVSPVSFATLEQVAEDLLGSLR